MLSPTHLRTAAKECLEDAKVLFRARRYKGSIYLCGYGVELSLKARICKTLHWTGFPETRAEFHRYDSLKTHDFETLLHFSGREAKIKLKSLADWSEVKKWKPEMRYASSRSSTRRNAQDMIAATTNLIRSIA